MDAVRRLGTVSLRRIYVNEHRNELWREELKRHSIEPVVVSSIAGGSKDPADIAIAWDVAEQVADGRCSAIAIASQDLDFAWVHKRVRSRKKKSLALLRDTDGRPCNVRRVMQRSASGVVLYNRSGGLKEVKRLAVDFRQPSKGITIVRKGFSEASGDVLDFERVQKKLSAVLAELGYWGSDVPVPLLELPLPDDFSPRVLFAAIARFYFVHDLGSTIVCPKPIMVKEAYQRITAKDISEWRRSPHGLVVVEPWRKPSAQVSRRYGKDSVAAIVASCGGPFVVQVSDTLVADILTRLGYSGEDEPLHPEMLDLFFNLNRKKLSTHGVSQSPSLVESKRLLHEIFASDSVEQFWRCAVHDTGVRSKLVQKGFLTSSHATRPEVFEAMGELLKRYTASELPSTYAMRATLLRRHMDQHQPDIRK